ncbi:MAG TPA: hypothetical protein VF089_14740 [Candidatus Binatia bacterium]
MICEAVPMEAAEENIYESLVSHWVAGGLQDLEPKDVVSESTQAEGILQKAAPVAATLRIPRQ